MGLFQHLFGSGSQGSTELPHTPESASPRIGSKPISPQRPMGFANRNENEPDSGLSRPLLELLSKFLHGASPNGFSQPYWDKALGGPATNAASHLVAINLLAPATSEAKLAATCAVAELKALARGLGLKVSGTKAELANRLVNEDAAGMDARMAAVPMLECTEKGRKAAEEYVANEKVAHDVAVADSLAYIKSGQYRLASRTMSTYEAGRVIPRGIGIDWNHADTTRDERILNRIFVSHPGILADVLPDDLAPLRIGAAMMHLWGTNRVQPWLPPEFMASGHLDSDVAARMILFEALNHTECDGWKVAGIKRVTVLGSGDSCPTCKSLAGKSFAIDRAPQLPHEHCSSDSGCRCCLVADV